MPRPKKQHFVPQLHLKHFVGKQPAGMLWTYDTQSSQARPSVPKETAAETNFYSVQQDSGEYDDRIEEWLAGVEDRAAVPYEGLLRGEIPTEQARADFAVFLSSLFARSPTTRRMYVEVIAARHQAVMKVITATPERFDAQLGRFEAEKGPIDPSVRSRLYAFAADSKNYTLNISREATLRAMSLSDDLLMIFFRMGWRVLISDAQTVITCDSPVVHVGPDNLSGFVHEKAEISFPLSPTHVLFLTWSSDRPGLTRIDRSVARILNVERARNAERFLYADRFEGGLQRLGQKHRRRGNRATFGGLVASDELPAIEIARK